MGTLGQQVCEEYDLSCSKNYWKWIPKKPRRFQKAGQRHPIGDAIPGPPPSRSGNSSAKDRLIESFPLTPLAALFPPGGGLHSRHRAWHFIDWWSTGAWNCPRSSFCGSRQWLPHVSRSNVLEKSVMVIDGQPVVGSASSRFCEERCPRPDYALEFTNWDKWHCYRRSDLQNSGAIRETPNRGYFWRQNDRVWIWRIWLCCQRREWWDSFISSWNSGCWWQSNQKYQMQEMTLRATYQRCVSNIRNRECQNWRNRSRIS